MAQLSLLDMLTSARQALQRTRDQVAESKQDMATKETELTTTLRSEFLKLREKLYETETRVLDEARNEYRQKLTELETFDGEISQKIQLLNQQLKFPDAVEIPISDVSVDADFVDFRAAAEKIKAITVIRRTQSEATMVSHTLTQYRIGSAANVLPELAASEATTACKRALASDDTSPIPAKKKKQQQQQQQPATTNRPTATLKADDPESEDDYETDGCSDGAPAAADVKPNPAAVKQEVIDLAEENVGETSSAGEKPLHAISNVRDFIKCSGCKKPRCIYARRAFSGDQKKEISEWKEKVRRRYKCGDKFPSLSSFSNDEVGVEDSVDCHSDVDIHYFHTQRKFPLACYTCGSENVAVRLTEEEKKNYSTYNPVCERCSAEGQEPRTRKRRRQAIVIDK